VKIEKLDKKKDTPIPCFSWKTTSKRGGQGKRVSRFYCDLNQARGTDFVPAAEMVSAGLVSLPGPQFCAVVPERPWVAQP